MRRTARRHILIPLVCLFVAGCGNSPNVPSGSSSLAPESTPAGASDSGIAGSFPALPSDEFTAPADPLNLTVTPDPSRSVTAHITTAGGSLTATGADGTTYALTVPPDALLDDTDITMTPIASVAGWSVAPGHTAAVLLAPDGLVFATPGQLVITPPQPITDLDGSPFRFYGDGQDAHLILPEPTATGIVIPVDHFSGHGFVWDVSIPFWLSWARYKQTQAEDRLVSRFAAELDYIRAQQKAGLTPDFSVQDVVEGITSAWERDVLNRRLLLASQSCKDAQFALNGYTAFNRNMQVLKLDQRIEAPPRLFNLARYLCAEEATRLCFATGDVERLARILLTDARSLAVMNASTNGDTSRYLEACDQFELQVAEHSDQNLGNGQGAENLKADITITIPIRYVPSADDTRLLGDTLGQAKGVLKSGTGSLATLGGTCSITLDKGVADVPFEATLTSLKFINTGPESTTRRFQDVVLAFMGGHLTANATIHCPAGSAPYGTRNLPFVFARYQGANQGAVTISTWDPGSYPTLATKTFTRTMSIGATGTGTETLVLKFIHTPGPMPPRPDIP